MGTKSTLMISLAASLAAAAQTLPGGVTDPITIEAVRPENPAAVSPAKSMTGDAATLFADSPGVSLNTGGGISSLPAIHGMADDRIRIDIDGMQITSACPNHMNPALSYIDSSKIAATEVIAGITPVSRGGDSIAGTITVRSNDPVFASRPGETVTSGTATGFYRSNNHARGVAVGGSAASDKISVSYAGYAEKAADYTAGGGRKVKDTLYEQQNRSATLAYKLDDGVVAFKLGAQNVNYEGFPNQYMDMLANRSTYGNISYKGRLGKILLDANVFRQQTVHYMNKLNDERPVPGDMPMDTKAEEAGFKVTATLPVSSVHVLTFGSDLDRYALNDWWSPVAGKAGMSPGTFLNLNNARRDRLGLFAESDYQWSGKLATLIGMRTDIVTMRTGDVHGYNGYPGYTGANNNDPVDAAAFNALDRSARDVNYDVTALAQYAYSERADLEFGFARKSRSPNLYERYAWAGGYGSNVTAAASSPIRMDMAMINWVGDGNGYVGNVNLKPEVANTLSATLSLHDAAETTWGLKLTPYYTKVFDFIDVNYLGKATGGMFANIALLQFANHDAVFYGADLSGYARVWDNGRFGTGTAKALVGYTRAARTDGGSLYHMMPLHAKVSLSQTLGAWENGIDCQAVDSKLFVDTVRNEPRTAGYALIDLRTRYRISHNVTLDAAVTNLFDKAYALPLGGVDLVNYSAASYTPLRGMGRSFNAALTLKF